MQSTTPVFGRESSEARSSEIAVIGMACRFPGGEGYEAFWEGLAQRRTAVREIPPDRWDWRAFWGDPQTERNKCNSRWGSFIERVDAFDASFFSVSARDAELLDPQQRIMLELAWGCFEDAGIRPSTVWGSRVGVYTGSAILDYKELLERENAIEAQYAAAVAHSVISSRISHWFNFTGPSLPMDTACSSSLYAIHLAAKSLQRGECTMALAGGVNILLTPLRYISFSKMGILSPTGACRSFDESADGTVRGEGAGVVLLKPLSQALEDGDPIHGIIKGSAINHSGKTHTLSYPNPVAQAEVIREAWRDARVGPETISYIEAHGTGTPKGDPLEFDGLRRAFEGAEGALRCGLGSVKTNLGHLESAAGIAGVIKVLMSMKQRQLPPLQNFQRLNHRIALDGTPFYLVDRLLEWRRPECDSGPAPLRAGVSSFGFAGTNAHVVLQEAPEQVRPEVANEGAPCFLVGLSAKTPEALGRAAGELRLWVEKNGSRVRLCELSAALLGTKERFSCRAAFLAKDLDELIRGLKASAQGAVPEGAWRGSGLEEKSPLMEELGTKIIGDLRPEHGLGEEAYRKKLAALAELYVKGVELDWSTLLGTRAPRDLRLPTYSFERERYWLPPGEGEARSRGAKRSLHPLVQENTSDLTVQRFASTFDGTEPFLAHHLVKGQKILPGAAYLEMARAALVLSVPGAEDAVVRLRDVVFTRPLRAGDTACRVEIVVSPEGESAGEVAFRISSAGEGGAQVEHCEGRAALSARAGAERLDLEVARARCTRRTLGGEACYEALRRLGFEHGPSHRGLETVRLGTGELLARIALPPERAVSMDGCILAPGLMDSALQAVLVLMTCGEGPVLDGEGLPVPFAVDDVEIRGACAAPMWVWVRTGATDEQTRGYDLDLCDEGGEVRVRLRGFTVREAAGDPAPAAVGSLMAVRSWQEQAPAPMAEAPAPVGARASDDARRSGSAFRRPSASDTSHLVLLCEPEAGVAEAVAARLEGARCVALGGEEEGISSRFVSAAAKALEEVRGVLTSMPRGGAVAQVVFCAGGDQRVYGALAGLLRSASHENPGFVGQTIELEQMSDAASVIEALTECARSPRDGEVRYRAGRRSVARWRELQPAPEGPPPWKDDGVYLLSGGAGGLGLVMAEEIARGAKRALVYLLGRSALTATKAERLGALEALGGCKVIYSQLDVARRGAVDALVGRIREEHGRLDGVLHAAGVLRDNFILRKDGRELEEVLAAKVHGAVNLDEATKDLPLDFFILFSSVAGVLGNAGQADYATANAFLDAYAALRAERSASGQRSGRTLSIDWPLWRDGGMSVDAEAERALWERFAMRAIETREGVRALHRALGSGSAQVLFMEGDLSRLRGLVLEPSGGAPGPSSSRASEPPSTPEDGAGVALEERAIELVKREMSAVLKVPPGRMDADVPMERHGIDSIVIAQLTRQLERTFGSLPKTLFFEYRNIRELAGYFLEAHGPGLRGALNGAGAPASPPAERVAPVAPRRARTNPPSPRFARRQLVAASPSQAGAAATDIAVIGVAGRYPGARNLREFWANLRDGKDSVTEIPRSRWDHSRYFDEDKSQPGKTYSKWGGFLDGVDEFDPLFFEISPREAEIMDPQERLFLQCVYETIEDAGYTREALRRSSAAVDGGGVGVFVGVMWEEYPLYGAQEQARGRNITVTGSPASIANRVSYLCDFCGPCMAVDTMCSSSLTAIHLACQSLERGECALAVAGGVNVSIHPNKYLALAAGRYVSSKGRCESFGEGGDGYVPGEGVGAVLLKPLADAVGDGDHIYGVIKGTAVNHGGKTNGFTVPSPRAQASVISAALKTAGIAPRAVSYLEAHGTGTSLGDPIEIAGLAKAFEAGGATEGPFCAIGSAKSNIGHCESAAGVAGLTKVLLQLKHRQLVPSLHSKRLNPNIQFERTPFRVQQELAAWERPVIAVAGEQRAYPRVAGISSFGAGGSNAHLVVEEYESKDPSEAAVSSVAQAAEIVLLSARDETRLGASARQLLDALRAGELGQDGLADVAYTLQVGREAMEERLALIAGTVGELEEKLVAFLEGKRDTDCVFRGRAGSSAQTVAGLAADEDMARTLEAWVEKQKYSRLLALWVEGLPFDWSTLHRDRRPRRVSLPTYPFARERYWVPEAPIQLAPVASRSVLHPLLHENTSDLGAQRFSSTFTGREFFLRDHVVGGRKVLPGAAQLELARAAVEAASGGLQAGNHVRLKDVIWPAPLVVDGAPVRVNIELLPEESGEIAFEIHGEGTGTDAVYSRGAAVIEPTPAVEGLDVEAVRARCSHGELSGAECYAAFEEARIAVGPSLRGIERVHLGREEALAKVSLPAAARDEGGLWGLHPSVLDSALQGAIGLLLADGGLVAALPFSLDELEILGETGTSMWAHIRRVRGASSGEGTHGFDIDLCDETGKPCARVKRLLLRPAPEVQGSEMEVGFLAPVWDAEDVKAVAAVEAVEAGRAALAGERRLVLVGADGARLRASLVEAELLEIRADDTAELLSEKVRALGAIDQVIWVAPEVPAAAAQSGGALLQQQSVGVLHLFRLLKALLGQGYGARALDWTVVTCGCLEVCPGDIVEPTHAGVHGLVGSMAKEFPHWRVRLVDVDCDVSAEQLAKVSADPSGRARALRGGEWHRRRLVPVARVTPSRTLYEKRAVYVVIGGAGGVGEVWTEHVLRAHQAQVVWIGRRPLDAAIRRKIDRLGALGPAPRYVQADAGHLESLRAAHRVIKEEFSEIHGLVHSAIVLRDQSLSNMDEETFRAAYAAKVDASVQMADVFGKEPLAFALFFSSTQGLESSAGQGNYAAGCTFEDAFARHLSRAWPCPVKVMSWGYWGEHGVVAGEAYRERMARAGIGSIAPPEAMRAVDELLASPLPQVAFIKTTGWARLESTATDEGIAVYPDATPAVLPALHLPVEAGALGVVAAVEAQEADERELLEDLLAVQLERAGVDWQSRAHATVARPDVYGPWLDECGRILATNGPLSPRNGEDAWARWELAKRRWTLDPQRRARVELAETMLRALPDILSGKRSATEVMFPGAGFALVEGVYRGNAIADFFNAATANVIEAYLEERLREDPAARIRILEVGAGTGAGSAAILARLDPHRRHIAEYCYSDVSKAFVLRGEEAHAQKRPFVKGRVFDVDAPVAGQGLEPGGYDLAVAVNVLHATQDVRRSLRNVKAALKKNGVLVLNELSQKSLFGHLTFGLLQGWWLHRDSALRIPGCPALPPERWQRVLEQEGFGAVLFPAREAHRAGQQIIVAQSDGVVRQRKPSSPSPVAREVSPIPLVARTAPEGAAGNGASGAAEQDDLRERGRDYLKKVVGEVLKIPTERIDTSEPLGRYGIDSILVVRLTNALRGVFGAVSTTMLFEHPTIDALIDEFLRSRREALVALASTEAPVRAKTRTPAALQRSRSRLTRASQPPEKTAAKRAATEEGPSVVAIVGLAGRYPKANDVREYWKNLKEGRHCVSEVPDDRWDWREYFSEEKGRWGSICTKWGGFLDDIARFDPGFFRLSPREALQMDPQERLFLEVAYASIEDAGYTPASLSGSRRVGVFAGVMNANYGNGAAHWSIANRVSHLFDFQGPSLAVDTACSSSLTAIHLALESLESETCECAVAGGVNLIVDPVHFMKLSAASMLSPGDQCRSFGEGADGMVDGEAVGAVLLKPLARALADGDHVYAVIRGSMLNAGGRTNGYTVPNPLAQARAIAEALRRARVSPTMVSYVEAHGTGTELGDPIEIAGLTRAFEQETDAKRFCAIGSVKSNIGHCESAAGIAGLTKVLLQMKHGQLAPSLHAKALNPRIDFANTPFTVQQALGEWKRPRVAVDGVPKEVPRIAGISSFGAGGANAHLVVEEYAAAPAAGAAAPVLGPALVVLSARTERDLQEKARQLAQVIEDAEIGDEQLADVAYTLQIGREAMTERLGLLASTSQELREKLEAFARGRCLVGCHRGRAAPSEGAASDGAPPVDSGAGATRGQLEEVLEWWVRGGALDWGRLSSEQRPKRVSLPTYPFAGERYWAPAKGERPRSVSQRPPHVAPAAPSSPAVEGPEEKAQATRPVRKPEAVRLVTPQAVSTPRPAVEGRPPRVALRPIATGVPASKPEPEPRRAESTLREELVASLAKALYMQPGDLDVDRKFVDMGLDSIIGVEWIKALNKQYGTSMKATIVYDHPNIRSFASFLKGELRRAGGAPVIEAPVIEAPVIESPVDEAPHQPVLSLRELLRQVQSGELSVEDASRLHLEVPDGEVMGHGASGSSPARGASMGNVLVEVTPRGGRDA